MMKVKIGDIIEIKTGKGLAYALFTHRHDKPPRYGALLRVFDELFPMRPTDPEALVKLPVRFTTFFPLQAAVSQGLVEVVGNVSIPEDLKAFPIFRSAMTDPRTKKVTAWWLWDGEHEWPVGAELTPEMKHYPISGIWNDTLLVKRIESGWRAEDEID